MSGVSAAFAHSYRQARDKFLQAARAAGLEVASKPHPLPGIDGEPLAMDIARDGPADAQRLLIVSSGCHGVEGYCGSGIQGLALADGALRRRAADAGVAVLYIHALNPYGFSHFRRTTHENVDLNRNFHDFGRPLPHNAGYGELHALLVPDTWPPDEANTQAIGQYLATRGEKAFQAAVSGGQHDYPDGLFFGGQGPSWSNRTVREVLREHAQRAARVGWIDIHTGLGPSGVGERIYAGRDDAASIARARAWWGGGGRTPLTSIYDGSSTSAFLTGMMFGAAYDECPEAEYTGLALEYGTVPVLQTMQALRAEQWLNRHPDAPPALADAIRAQVFEAFYTDTDAWREQVAAQGREAMLQGIEGLAS